MKFLLVTFTAALASLTLAADAIIPSSVQAACPTITKQAINPICAKDCSNDCRIYSTVTNACGCPAQVPTATLFSPCDAACPYNGCKMSYRTSQLPCATTPASPPPPPPTTTTTTTSSFIITITTLPPGKPTTTARPCPTVTVTTRPGGCQPIRCPIPGCTYEEDMIVPCGCAPRTLLSVDGCQTACPTGCATRTNTFSQLCVTPTPLPAQPSA
ncbi:hypothetical protein HD806DRAFT_385590 [Xylariaceae sp. AK1471]|nr:hypothetical protein HD806DRAFT_385590 [Xylariaceae sp. AK1471]